MIIRISLSSDAENFFELLNSIGSNRNLAVFLIFQHECGLVGDHYCRRKT